MKRDSVEIIQRIAKQLESDKKLLEAQLKEVEEKYPLVAFAYYAQCAAIYDLSTPRRIGDTQLGAIYDALEPVSSEAFTRVQVEQAQRLEALQDCLLRSHRAGSSGQQYQAGRACFENYANGNS